MDLLIEIRDIIIRAIIENAGTVIAFVVATTFAIIANYYRVKAYRLSKQQAEKAPKLTIRLYNQNADGTLYFVLPFKPHRKFLIPLRLTIKNEGSLSAKDVEVFMEMNDSLYSRDAERKVSNIAAARNVTYAAQEGRNKYMTTSYKNIGNLPPGQELEVVDEISIDRTTVVEIPIEETTKDDVKVKIIMRTMVELIIIIKVTYEHAPPINNLLRLQFRKGSANRTNQFMAEEEKLIQDFYKKEKDLLMPRCFIFFEEYEYVTNLMLEARYWIYRANHNSVKVVKGKLEKIRTDVFKNDNA